MRSRVNSVDDLNSNADSHGEHVVTCAMALDSLSQHLLKLSTMSI